jgi:hypothetical protein
MRESALPPPIGRARPPATASPQSLLLRADQVTE